MSPLASLGHNEALKLGSEQPTCLLLQFYVFYPFRRQYALRKIWKSSLLQNWTWIEHRDLKTIYLLAIAYKHEWQQLFRIPFWFEPLQSQKTPSHPGPQQVGSTTPSHTWYTKFTNSWLHSPIEWTIAIKTLIEQSSPINARSPRKLNVMNLQTTSQMKLIKWQWSDQFLWVNVTHKLSPR